MMSQVSHHGVRIRENCFKYWTIVRPNKLNLTPLHLTQFFMKFELQHPQIFTTEKQRLPINITVNEGTLKSGLIG